MNKKLIANTKRIALRLTEFNFNNFEFFPIFPILLLLFQISICHLQVSLVVRLIGVYFGLSWLALLVFSIFMNNTRVFTSYNHHRSLYRTFSLPDHYMALCSAA
ncbi:hypothetical protein BpHYR1_002435 [Brachionus plicatilis]|uniref:Uncharacterized protein n=1 Tax=Brachionus plicatilis TaxID=10195 RepID=A0A3M7QX25_BRAPC|nr:hypothetical protein BpHYR1_002435 [Brachionus plicatilis]